MKLFKLVNILPYRSRGDVDAERVSITLDPNGVSEPNADVVIMRTNEVNIPESQGRYAGIWRVGGLLKRYHTPYRKYMVWRWWLKHKKK